MEEGTVTISRAGTAVLLNCTNNEVFRIQRGAANIIYAGGAPADQRTTGGWSHSELLLGPTPGPSFGKKIRMDGQEFDVTGKHGIMRKGDLWRVVSSTNESITLKLSYQAGTQVQNEDGVAVFPRSFEATRTISIDDKGAVTDSVTVKNLSDKPMPFAFGFHPAYQVPKGSFVEFQQAGKPVSVTTEEVHADLPSQVKLFENVGSSIRYVTPTYTLNFTTSENLNVLWLWNKFDNCLAIESLSASVQRKDAPLDQMPGYENQIASGEERTYKRTLRIEPHPPLTILV